MTQEEYNRLDSDFAHCAGTHCKKTENNSIPQEQYNQLSYDYAHNTGIH